MCPASQPRQEKGKISKNPSSMEHDNNNNKVHPNGKAKNGVHPPNGISLNRKPSAVETIEQDAIVSAKETTATTTSTSSNGDNLLLLNDNSNNSLSTLSLPSATGGILHNSNNSNNHSGTSLRGDEGSVSSNRPTTPTNHKKHKTRRQARYEAKRQQYCQNNHNQNNNTSPTTAPMNGLVVSAAAGRAVSPLTTADLHTTTPTTTTTPTGPRNKKSIAERAQAKMRAFAKARQTEEEQQQQQQQQEGSIEFPPRSTTTAAATTQEEENVARQPPPPPQQQLLPEDTSEIPQQVAFVLQQQQQQQQQQKLSPPVSSPNMTATANNVASAAAVATTPRASSWSSYESRIARKMRNSTHHRDHRQANNNINSIPEDHESFHNEEVVSVSSATPQNMMSVDTPLGREVLLEPNLDDLVNSDLGASSEIDFDGSRGHGAHGGGVESDRRESVGPFRRRGSIASHNTETTEMREAGDDVPEMPGAFQVQGRPVGDMPEWHQRNLHPSTTTATPLSYSSGRSGVRGGRPLARDNSWLQRSHRFVQRILSTHSSTSSRNDELGASSSRNDGLVEANMVSEAEAVVYASDVVKDRSSRTKLLLRIAGCCAVLVIVGLTAGITSMLLERSNDDGTMEDLGNPRCRLPMSEQNAFDHCDCYGTAQGLKLMESEISLYALITDTFLEEGLINQTYERTSCALENQGLLSLANFLRLGYAEEQLTVMVYPQNEREVAVQNLGLLTMHQRFILLMLYFRMDAPGWKNNDGWLYRRETCWWHGVGCAYFERIETIRLASNNLSGEMLALICKMPFLRECTCVFFFVA